VQLPGVQPVLLPRPEPSVPFQPAKWTGKLFRLSELERTDMPGLRSSRQDHLELGMSVFDSDRGFMDVSGVCASYMQALLL
jgi:hypothetical protein